MQTIVEQIHDYLASTWRYRWVGVAAAWLVGIAGWIAISFIPDRYQATTRVYVDTQSILRPLLAGLAMQPNVTQIVEMMSRTLISRPNVEKVVRMANLEPEKPASAVAHEELLNRLARELSV